MAASVTAPAAARVGAYVVGEIIKAIWEDNPRRERFVQAFVDRARRDYPDYGVVIIHTTHSRSGKYVHQHYELPISFGRTIGYEVYFVRRGEPFTLTNRGDGGWINWGYAGWFNRSGKTITAR